jgi:site-specific recombinase XerD
LKLREKYKNSEGNHYLFISPQSLHGSMSSYAVQKRMKIYCEHADIPSEKAHPHTLRHSVGIHLLEKGKDVHYVSFHLGHTSLKTTMIYLQLAPPEWWKKQHEAVSGLDI